MLPLVLFVVFAVYLFLIYNSNHSQHEQDHGPPCIDAGVEVVDDNGRCIGCQAVFQDRANNARQYEYSENAAKYGVQGILQIHMFLCL